MQMREVHTQGGFAAFRRCKFAAAAMTAAILVVSTAASAQTRTITTNSSTNSAPTTQNVNVVNTPNVNATVVNTPSVNATVVNTPNVSATVANTASNPVQSVDAEKLARIPFQILNGSTCGSNPCQVLISLSKSGYRAVLETVTAFFELPAGTTEAPLLGVGTSNPSHNGQWTLVAKLGPTVSGQVMAGLNEKVLAYFDAADNSNFLAYGNISSVLVTLTGYYENCAVTGCPPII